MNTPIRNLKDLRAERRRIINERTITAFTIDKEIEDIKHFFNPLKMVSDYAKQLLFNNNGGVINDGIRNAVGTFAYKNLLKFLPWPARTVASFLLKNYATNYMVNNKDTIAKNAINILTTIKNLFSKKEKVNGTLVQR